MAALHAKVMYDLVVPGLGPQRTSGVLNGPPGATGEGEPADLSVGALGLPDDAILVWMRMLHLGQGPTVELFQYSYGGQRRAGRGCDLGLQHFAVYVGDIDAASQDIAAAGGELLDGPNDCPGLEAGPGARWRYARLPWGSLMELITYPASMPYEAITPLRRTWSSHVVSSLPLRVGGTEHMVADAPMTAASTRDDKLRELDGAAGISRLEADP